MEKITELSHIQLRGAKEHNLKNINIDIPKKSLVVITGVSGSGKSSLAFDTLCAEGQRRYVESLSSYARQFIGQSEKPKYETIRGLCPTISIDQKATSKNPRSTVGTITEIYDYLRILFARVGVQYCIKCNKKVGKGDPHTMLEQILSMPPESKMTILAPLIENRKGEYKDLLNELRSQGFTRIRLDGVIQKLEDVETLAKNKKHNIELVVDRFTLKSDPKYKNKYLDSLELALKKGQGNIIIHIENKEDIVMSQNRTCCGESYPELSPQLFSFNSPIGSCPECQGIGDFYQVDESKVIIDPASSIETGAIGPWNNAFDLHKLPSNINSRTAWNKLSSSVKKEFLYGNGKNYEGLIPKLNRIYAAAQKEDKESWISKYVTQSPCKACNSMRLKPVALNVRVATYTINDLTTLSISNLQETVQNLNLKGNQKIIGQEILKELQARVGFLNGVGLGYLSLNRSGPSLSGGEAQRIRLAGQIGSELTGVLYVLDEPSIGLHQRDNKKLIQTLKHLRDLGNSLLVVEHDEETMMESDWIIDIGPAAGHLGGNIVAQGTPQEILKNPLSITGQYLSHKRSIEMPKERRPWDPKKVIKIEGANGNNLKNLTVEFPLGVFTCITGVSGAGKSTLINQILVPVIKNYLEPTSEYRKTSAFKKITGIEHINKIIDIDQKPIGRTPRSNPATYTKVLDHIRDLFAQLPESKARGFEKGRFSFNVKGGRCEQCEGDGVLTIEMHFLADITVPCETCLGKRFNDQTLEIKFKGHSINDVLNLSVAQAIELFEAHPKITKILTTLMDVGLSYIQLGQSATTLSGGEAQRIKLSKELAKSDTGNTLYILDEPTTGLHFEDINRLMGILSSLVNRGNTILVIEHNLDVIKCADHIIDLGPEGGSFGGEIVATGTPEMVVKNKKSITGVFLKQKLV